MSLHALANHMAAQGRGPDQVLVHMSPRELQGLQSLAVAHGGTLTTNPHTGLPEAGFLDSVLPIAAGFLLGPAGFGIAETALGAAGIVGGITGLATGSLSKGLMAGLGAYGGSSLGTSLMGAGTTEIARQAMTPELMSQAADAGANYDQVLASETAAKQAAATPYETLSAGAKAVGSDPMSFAKSNWQGLAAAASPMLASSMVPTATKMPTFNPGYIRPYDYNPQTMGFTRMEPIKADFSELPKKNTPATTGLNALQSAGTAADSGYATGGIIALADGGDPYAQFNKLSGQSKAAYDYLMGNSTASGPTVTPGTTVVPPVVVPKDPDNKPVVTPRPPRTVDPDGPVTPPPPVVTPDPGHVVEPPSNDHTTPDDTDVVVTPVPDSPNNSVITDANNTTTHVTSGDGNGSTGSSTGGTGTTGTTGGAGGDTTGGAGGTGGTGGETGTTGSGAKGGSGSGPAGGTSGGITDLTAGNNGSADTSGGISDLTRTLETGTNQGGLGTGDSAGVGPGTGAGGLPAGAVDNGDGTYSVDHPDGTTGLYAGDGTYLGATGEVPADFQSSATGRGPGGDGTQGPAVPNVTLTSNTAGVNPGVDDARSITYDYPELLSPADRAIYDAAQNAKTEGNTAPDTTTTPTPAPTTPDSGSDATTRASGWWDDPLGIGGGSGSDRYALSGFDGGGGGGGGGGCPAPWINILLADGGTVQAGNMKPGMQVFTRHEKTDEWGVYPVTAVSFGEDERWEVVLEDGRVFLGTFNHRVCAVDKDWIEIRDLQPGDKLVQQEGFGVVKSSTKKDHGTIVKITVDGAHTYISEGFLSHNMKYEGGWGGFMEMANGGMTPGYALGGLGSLGGFSDGGQLLRGPGDGVSDSIPASIGNRQPARLADGEFVVPARIVSELGNGSTEAGARQLYAMMDRIQKNRKKSIGKGNVAVNSHANKHLPA